MARVVWIVLLWFCTSLYAEPLNIGIFEGVIDPSISRKDYMIGTKVFVREYTQQEGYETNLITYETVEKLVSDFKKERIDAIIADPLTLVRNIPKTDLKSGVMAFKRNKADSHTLVVLGRSDDTRSLSALLKANITTIDDPIADLYLKILRLEEKLPADTPSKSYAKTAHHGVLKLFFGGTDLVICDRSAYLMASELNPQLNKRLRVLTSLPVTIGAVLYFRKSYPDSNYENIIRSGLKLNHTERGKQLLRVFRSSVVETITLQDLDTVSVLDQRFSKLKDGRAK